MAKIEFTDRQVRVLLVSVMTAELSHEDRLKKAQLDKDVVLMGAMEKALTDVREVKALLVGLVDVLKLGTV